MDYLKSGTYISSSTVGQRTRPGMRHDLSGRAVVPDQAPHESMEALDRDVTLVWKGFVLTESTYVNTRCQPDGPEELEAREGAPFGNHVDDELKAPRSTTAAPSCPANTATKASAVSSGSAGIAGEAEELEGATIRPPAMSSSAARGTASIGPASVGTLISWCERVRARSPPGWSARNAENLIVSCVSLTQS
jgi:hypothetical protein